MMMGLMVMMVVFGKLTMKLMMMGLVVVIMIMDLH